MQEDSKRPSPTGAVLQTLSALCGISGLIIASLLRPTDTITITPILKVLIVLVLSAAGGLLGLIHLVRTIRSVVAAEQSEVGPSDWIGIMVNAACLGVAYFSF